MAPNDTNTTNQAGGGGPMEKPGGAPDLPDAVPDAVQSLLDGIFGFGGEMGKAFGDLVSGLAGAIGGNSEAGMVVASHLLDAAGVLV